MRRALVESVPREVISARPLYVHMDLDVRDPRELQGFVFPVPGGPTLDDLGESLQGWPPLTGSLRPASPCTWDAGMIDREKAARVVTVVRDALDFR